MKKYLSVITAALICTLALSGCGGMSNKAGSADTNGYVMTTSSPGDYGWYDENAPLDENLAIPEEEPVAEIEPDYYDVEAPAMPEPAPTVQESDAIAPSEQVGPTAGEADAESVPKDTARKIIKTCNLYLETLEYDAFINGLESSVAELGGYVEKSSVSGESRLSNRYAYYTVRIPVENYDAFINTVGELGTVTSIDESIDDATLRYIDLEARLESLKAERDSFLSLLERAQTVEEILQIQSYLTDVNYQIESYTSQMNSLKNRISYSTVNINVSEVERVTAPQPKTVGERIKSDFSDNIYRIKTGATDFFVWAVASSPYILIYAVVIAVIVTGIVIAARSGRKKKPAPEQSEKKQEDGEGK